MNSPSIRRGNRKRAGLYGTTWKGNRRYTQGDLHQKALRQLSMLASMRSGSSGMSLLLVLRTKVIIPVAGVLLNLVFFCHALAHSPTRVQ